MSKRIFTSESVTEGHPDKICDQISDGVLDAILAKDPQARVACECATTTGLVLVMGEITTNCYVDIAGIARDTITRIGYDNAEYGFDGRSCAVLTAIDKQSEDIAMGVDASYDDANQEGAGDQGMMFGFACNETKELMPAPISYAHNLTKALTKARKDGKLSWLRPDGKSQVSVQYGEHGEVERIDTVVVSTQHDEFITAAEAGSQEKADEMMLAQIEKDVKEILIPRVIEERVNTPEIKELFKKGNIRYFVNPTGKFVIGGPHGDTGLTGRKIIVDTYGGKGAHGGGAFSGKDPSKVDRSAAYAARYIAKNMVAAGVADEMLVQLSYAIGVAQPISIYVDTYGRSHVQMTDGEIAQRIGQLFDLRPAAIERELELRHPIYEETASYGHMGREPRTVVKTFHSMGQPDKKVSVELFTWEKLNKVEMIKKEFGLA